MRIAMISEHASPLAVLGGQDAGGQNVHVAALSTALARRGHRVTVYTRRDSAGLPARVPFAPGVEVVNVTAGPPEPIPKDDLLPWMQELAEGVAADWRERRPDVVHSHFWMSGLAALDAVAIAGGDPPVPTLHTFHALGHVKRRYQGARDTSPAERAWLEPRVGARVDRVVATCPSEAIELRHIGVANRKISVVPCGVDLASFRPEGPAVDREPAGPPDRPLPAHRVLSVGRLVPRKGVDTIVRAMRLLVDAGRRDVELWIVGGEMDRAHLRRDPDALRLARLARSLGVRPWVRLVGPVPHCDLPALIRGSDAVVCAPWYEPFGIVPLEAMACGVPVVAARVGGLADSVADGVVGLLVPPRDPASIARAVATLVEHPDEARDLGRAGRERVERRYSWSRVAELTERAYLRTLRDVVGGGGVPAIEAVR